jgi:hypothetical protein
MTHTARALLIGPVVGLGLWATASAAVPAAPTVIVEPTAAPPPASEGGPEVLLPPALTDVVAPLVLAALCGTAAAFFSPRPRYSLRPRVARRRTRS